MNISPLELQDLAFEVVEEYANTLLPEGMMTIRQTVCSPGDYSKVGVIDRSDQDRQKALEEFQRVPVAELTRPRPTRYYCAALGPVMVLNYKSKTSVRVSDVTRISGLSSEELHDFIAPEHFVRPDLLGAGDASPEFIDWTAASLFCINTPKGQMLIAWMNQVILDDLLGGFPPISASAFSASLLFALLSMGLEFPAWKKKFLRRFPEAIPDGGTNSSEDFGIPLALAKRFALENYHFYGLIAYILVREAEETRGNDCETIGDPMPIIARLQRDCEGRIDARVLHLFLKSERSFDIWIRGTILGLGLVAGKDYVPEIALDAGAHDSVAGVQVTIEAAIYFGMATQTARGRLIEEYFNETAQFRSSQVGSSEKKAKRSSR